MSEDEILAKVTGTRSLKLTKSLHKKFDSIKNFKHFNQYFAHDFFHSFYSMGVSMAITDSEFLNEIQDINKNFKINPKKEEMINSINSEQLEHHDLLFKIIAYWVLMKQGDSGCFIVLTDIDLARKICEEIFIRYFDNYYDTLNSIGSELPNFHLLLLYKDLIFNDEK